MSAAAFRVGQSDWDPMMMPTGGTPVLPAEGTFEAIRESQQMWKDEKGAEYREQKSLGKRHFDRR
jgi:hypothetical protein